MRIPLPNHMSFYELSARKTGITISHEDFYKQIQEELSMEKLQNQIVEMSRRGGYELMKPEDRWSVVHRTATCTSVFRDKIDKFRNCNFLPISQARNKRSHQTSLEYAFRVIEKKDFCRMLVVSAGWVEFCPDEWEEFRDYVSKFNTTVGRLVRRDWFKEYYSPMSRTTEMTFHREVQPGTPKFKVKEGKLYIHLHGHIMIHSHRKMGTEKWKKFTGQIKTYMHDNGYKHYVRDEVLRNPAECAKYLCKFFEEKKEKEPHNLDALQDAPTYTTETGLTKLRDEEMAGLAQAMERLHLTDSYGAFAQMKKEIKEEGRKIVKFTYGERVEFALSPRQVRGLQLETQDIMKSFIEKFPEVPEDIIEDLRTSKFWNAPLHVEGISEEAFLEAMKLRKTFIQVKAIDMEQTMSGEKAKRERGGKPKNIVVTMTKPMSRLTRHAERELVMVNADMEGLETKLNEEGQMTCPGLLERALDKEPKLIRQFYEEHKAWTLTRGSPPPIWDTSAKIRQMVKEFAITQHADPFWIKKPKEKPKK